MASVPIILQVGAGSFHISLPRLPEGFIHRRIKGEILSVYVQNETGRETGRAVQIRSLRLRKVEFILCPGHSHEGKAPFLFHASFRPCLPGGEDAFIHAAEEHHRKFQTLGGMDCHKPHRILLRPPVHIGKESRMVQIVGNGRFFPCR